MKNIKRIITVLVLVAAFLLEPINLVYADENYDRTKAVPRLNSSEVKFETKNFFDWFGIKDKPEENCIEKFILAHLKLPNVDYNLYELVCDFELKTMGENESIATSNYSYTIDFENYEKGFLDSLLVQFNLKEDYFEHIFDYFEIVRNAEGFKERDINGKGKYFTYNTVISKVDFYFREKATGKLGESRRFTFRWDSNFWLQKCTKIEFSWFNIENEIEKEIGSVESESGVGGYSSNTIDTYLDIEKTVWDDILGFFTDIPAAIIAFFTGFIGLFDSLKGLILVVFPFIPASVISVLMIMICFCLLIGIYRFVQGWFG